ncbi:MAG: cell division ATP-binding protein FtsE [Parcubacteria group bacterium GW2011_GWA2_38_13b]|nr:MAG: cell division ATP-binding protein FtsE [Parcubacteria group bacterium GW2011_GWA2_38_13b]
MIKFEKISKIYPPDSVALKDVSFTVEKNEFCSVVGRSGAGKSTLLKMLIREEDPTSGKIFIDDVEVTSLNRKELPFLRRKIGAVFQDFKLLPYKTVYENIAFAMEVIGMDEEFIKADVPQVLALVGLAKKANLFPYQLSGGEKQRVGFARALVYRPEILIADEPTGNLDLLNTLDVIRLLLKINELGTTVILATHDKTVVDNLQKRVVTLNDGKVIRDAKQGKYIL